MALPEYGVGNLVILINGYEIKNFSHNETAVVEEPIAPKRQLISGINGNGVKVTRPYQPWRVTLNIMPGSPDSDFLSNLNMTDPTILYIRKQIGSGNLESAIGSEGVLVNMGNIERGGTPSADVYIFEFNKFVVKMGGTADEE